VRATTKPQSPKQWTEFWLELVTQKGVARALDTPALADCQQVIKAVLDGHFGHPATIKPEVIASCAQRFDASEAGAGTRALQFFFRDVIKTDKPEYQENLARIREQLGIGGHRKSLPSKPSPTNAAPPPQPPSEGRAVTATPVDPNAAIIAQMRTACRAVNYSRRTEHNYTTLVGTFLAHMAKPVDRITTDEIQRYLIWLHDERGQAPESVNVARCAIAFCWERVLHKPISLQAVRRMKEPLRLPPVYAKSEIKRILAAPTNPKHRLILMLAYGCGLRLGDLVNLCVQNIDWERGMIIIRQGKGQKDRAVMLPKTVRPLLDAYLKTHPRYVHVFENDTDHGPLTRRTFGNVYYHACSKAGVEPKGGIHALRHTFATHSLERGTDIRYIQGILGHANIRTTMIYTHITDENVANVPSPLDDG
jgi:integrase/recombinase XerD